MGVVYGEGDGFSGIPVTGEVTIAVDEGDFDAGFQEVGQVF
jgi:hypothetical protein